jgi:nucleotide-binding universal stress UspA family protein
VRRDDTLDQEPAEERTVTQRSVVGFDGTEPSRAALAWAIRRGGPILIAHVADSDSGLMGADYGRAVEQAATDLLARTLADVAERVPEADVEGVLLDGPVAWSLAQFAAPDDILVIGTHKTGFLHGRVLGSRSIEVAMLANCDVMVVPTIDMRFRAGVVAGIADDVALRDVVESSARVASERGEELLLLHSTEHRNRGSERPVGADAVAIARAVAPDIVIRTRASNRHTSELLLDAARDRALLVLGGGSGDRTRSPIGSVLHDVLLNLTAPVLVTHGSAGHPDDDAPDRVRSI